MSQSSLNTQSKQTKRVTPTHTWSKMDRGTAGTCGHVTDARSLAITAYFSSYERRQGTQLCSTK